jgi:hypothetical protein
LGLPRGFGNPAADFFVPELDRLGKGALGLGFGRGVRGFERVRDAIVKEPGALEGVLLGGVGGLPIEGVKGIVFEEEVFSRGFLNIAEEVPCRRSHRCTRPWLNQAKLLQRPKSVC